MRGHDLVLILEKYVKSGKFSTQYSIIPYILLKSTEPPMSDHVSCEPPNLYGGTLYTFGFQILPVRNDYLVQFSNSINVLELKIYLYIVLGTHLAWYWWQRRRGSSPPPCSPRTCQVSSWSIWNPDTLVCHTTGTYTRARTLTLPATCGGSCPHFSLVQQEQLSEVKNSYKSRLLL